MYADNIKQVIAQNNKARYLYSIDLTLEAGIVLTGTEVKSLRYGKASIGEAYAEVSNEEVYLINSHIPEYVKANRNNHTPTRVRKLLLKKKEIKKLIGMVKNKGMTLIPLSLYFNHKNIAKLLIGIAKGKTSYDKRETIKQREWERSKNRMEFSE